MAKYIIDIPDEAIELMGGHIRVFVEPEFKMGDCKYYALQLSKENIELYTDPDLNITKENPVHLCDSCKRVDSIEPCPIKKNDILCGEDGEGGKGICCCKAYIPEITDRKAIENEVWEFAREISTINYEDYIKCFDIDDMMEGSAYTKYTYQEAKEKYEAWKKEKDEFRVGDEVIYDSKIGVLLATETQSNYARIFIPHFPYTYAVTREELLKTGRHFDAIDELLNKMKEE